MTGYEKLKGTVKTNTGEIPVPDYLDQKAYTYGFSSYKELYNEGMRISGYSDITPEDLERYYDDLFADREKEEDMAELIE